MKGILGHFLKDFKLKILSLVLAVLLWFTVSYIGESKMSVSVQVYPQDLSSDYMVENIDSKDILVTLGGPVSILKNIRAKDIMVTIDMSNAKDGRHVYTINRDNITVPKGIKVENVKPDSVAVDIGRVVHKKLRIVVKLGKKWLNIYKAKSWYPKYAYVEGSRESLRDRSFVETVPVDGHFKNDTEETDVPMDTGNMLINKIAPETVRVILERSPQPETR